MAVLDRVEVDDARLHDRRLVRDPWFASIPAIAQICTDGIDLGPVTVVVGENGSGKSTFVEAVARRWESRLTAAVKHWTPDPAGEDTDMHHALVLHGEWPMPQGGCFLRAESMHRLFGDIDAGRGDHDGAHSGLRRRVEPALARRVVPGLP